MKDNGCYNFYLYFIEVLLSKIDKNLNSNIFFYLQDEEKEAKSHRRRRSINFVIRRIGSCYLLRRSFGSLAVGT